MHHKKVKCIHADAELLELAHVKVKKFAAKRTRKQDGEAVQAPVALPKWVHK